MWFMPNKSWGSRAPGNAFESRLAEVVDVNAGHKERKGFSSSVVP